MNYKYYVNQSQMNVLNLRFNLLACLQLYMLFIIIEYYSVNKFIFLLF